MHYISGTHGADGKFTKRNLHFQLSCKTYALSQDVRAIPMCGVHQPNFCSSSSEVQNKHIRKQEGSLSNEVSKLFAALSSRCLL